MNTNQLGQFLKSEREKRGLSLQEVSLSLKVSLKVLQGIESGNSEGLPAKAFLRGFVKSYAQFLKLDIAHTHELFRAQYDSEAEKNALQQSVTPAVETSEKSEKSESVAETKKVTPSLQTETSRSRAQVPFDDSRQFKWGPVVLISGLSVMILVVWFLLAQTEDSQEISDISNSQISETNLTSTTTMIDSVAEIATDTGLVSPTTGLLNSTTSTTSSVLTSSTTLTSPPSTQKPPVIATTTTSAATTTTTTKPKISVDVILESKSNAQLNYSIDGMPQKSLTLSAEEVHTFRGKESVELDLLDGGAFNVIVNGKSKGAPGASGVPIKVKYP